MQDQAAFDAMAKDVEERTKTRQASKDACAKEREYGNVAFKAQQYTEALAAYTRAIEHFKGDKTAHANRAAAHLKLRNWLSALDDCSRVIDVSKFLDEDHSHRRRRRRSSRLTSGAQRPTPSWNGSRRRRRTWRQRSRWRPRPRRTTSSGSRRC